MSFRGLPVDESGFIRMDAFDARDPDELPGLPDPDDEPVPYVDDRRLESLLERVLEGEVEADASLLPAGGESGPFDEADGAPEPDAPPGDEAGPFGEPVGDDPVGETDAWADARDPGPEDHELEHGDDDFGWDS